MVGFVIFHSYLFLQPYWTRIRAMRSILQALSWRLCLDKIPGMLYPASWLGSPDYRPDSRTQVFVVW